MTDADTADPNVERLKELSAKVDSGQELTPEDETFLDQMAADPNYDISVEEVEEETDEFEDE